MSDSKQDSPSFLQPHANGTYLRVRLQPRASRNEIGESLGDELKVRVTAPPVDSAANQALLDLLRDRLGCSRQAIQLVKGQTSRQKTIFLHGLTPAYVKEKLFSEK